MEEIEWIRRRKKTEENMHSEVKDAHNYREGQQEGRGSVSSEVRCLSHAIAHLD